MIEDLGSSAGIGYSSSNVGSRGPLELVKRWTRVWAVAFVLWTILAFLTAASAHVYAASMGNPESWAQLLTWNITVSFVWSLLTPPIYAVVSALRFRARQLAPDASPAPGILCGLMF